MHIDYFCSGTSCHYSVGAQSEELNIVIRAYIECGDAGEKTVVSSTYGGVLPVHDDPWNNSIRIVQFSSEARNERNDYPHL